MSTETELIEHLDEVNKVVTEYLKGQDPTKISKELDIPRTRVVSLIKRVFKISQTLKRIT